MNHTTPSASASGSAASQEPQRYLTRLYPGLKTLFSGESSGTPTLVSRLKFTSKGEQIWRAFHSELNTLSRAWQAAQDQKYEPKAVVASKSSTASAVRRDYEQCTSKADAQLTDEERSFKSAFESQKGALSGLPEDHPVFHLTGYLQSVQGISEAETGSAEDQAAGPSQEDVDALKEYFFDGLTRLTSGARAQQPSEERESALKSIREMLQEVFLTDGPSEDSLTIGGSLLLAMTQAQPADGSRAGSSRGPPNAETATEKSAGGSCEEEKSTPGGRKGGDLQDHFNEKQG